MLCHSMNRQEVLLFLEEEGFVEKPESTDVFKATFAKKFKNKFRTNHRFRELEVYLIISDYFDKKFIILNILWGMSRGFSVKIYFEYHDLSKKLKKLLDLVPVAMNIVNISNAICHVFNDIETDDYVYGFYNNHYVLYIDMIHTNRSYVTLKYAYPYRTETYYLSDITKFCERYVKGWTFE